MSVKEKLHRGSQITVRLRTYTGEVCAVARARVVHAHRGRISARSVGVGSSIRGTLLARDEGQDWVRGWDTPDALALQAEIALLVSR